VAVDVVVGSETVVTVTGELTITDNDACAVAPAASVTVAVNVMVKGT
jgi:hypothetical protein